VEDALEDYVRPELAPETYRDAGGAVIPYGERWPGCVAPDAAYSVCAHPQRFAPLTGVARALVAHLHARYRTALEEDGRTLVLTPEGEDRAPLAFRLTDLPGVELHAGLVTGFRYPDCGCDACDDDVPVLVEELEERVAAVVSGRFREWCGGGVRRGRAGYVVVGPDGEFVESAEGGADRDKLRRLARSGRALPARWAPWTPR
jgi:hypothetical protein